MGKQMSSGSFKNVIYKIGVHKSYIFIVCTYKQELFLNSLQSLTCHKIESTNQPTMPLKSIG